MLFKKFQAKSGKAKILFVTEIAAIIFVAIAGFGLTYVLIMRSSVDISELTEQNAQTAALGSVYQDIVVTKNYSDLPSAIKNGLGYNANEVKAVVYAEASLITKASSFVLSVSDAISRLSNIIIGGVQSKKELNKALESTVAQELIAKGGKVGEVVVTVYKINEAGELVQQAVKTAKIAKNAVSAPLIAAQALGIVLDAEMTYINNNLSGGLKNLWTLNLLSRDRLKMYIIFVAAANKRGLEDIRGIRFYYFDDKKQNWVNYYTDMTGADVMLRK